MKKPIKSLDDIAVVLREQRAKLKISQKTLATSYALNRKSVVNAEAGHDIQLSSLIKMASGLGLTLVLMDRFSLSTLSAPAYEADKQHGFLKLPYQGEEIIIDNLPADLIVDQQDFDDSDFGPKINQISKDPI